MISYLASLGVWNWFLLGAVLLALEALVPGTFMLWFGTSAVTVGLISLAVVWPWQVQLVAFSVLSIGSKAIRSKLPENQRFPFRS